MNDSPLLAVGPLGFPWACFDPFLFCAYHLDRFPKGNEELGPAVPLTGRALGQDFENKDGWNMYHGHINAGFPQHPHRGFETVTVVRHGHVDHSDSLGATARYGEGDAQWLTTGRGISHSEMFPLLKMDEANLGEAFQIWLNLPPEKKMAEPRFSIVWAGTQPQKDFAGVQVRLIAGSFAGLQAPPPPPDSWAAVPGSQVVIATLKWDAKASWVLPKAEPGLNRTLYFFKGGATVAGQKVKGGSYARLQSDSDVEIRAGDQGAEALLLQGRPIAAPVAQYGPFVMNSRAELEQAFQDYRETAFGGWPWPSDAPVHERNAGRFAKYPDGREERP
jgi:redox-sensitive bicupin YhaK (pirin superfamily)